MTHTTLTIFVQSMEVPCLYPQTSLCRLYHRGPRFLERPSTALGTSRRLYLAHSSDKLSFLNHSCHNAQWSFSFLPCNQRTAKWKHFNQREELYKAPDNNKLRDHSKCSRCVIARSELAGFGTQGAAHSESDVKLASKIRGVCFYAVTAINAIVLFVLMLVGHPFVMLFDRHQRKFHHFIAKLWAFFTVAPFFNIKFEGLENLPPPNTPAVYVSNHQSFLDIYTLLTLGRSFKLISKTGIFVFPIIGWAMFFMGVIPLKRMDSRSQLDCLRRCMYLVNKGVSVFFFPEGTRSKDGQLGAFKKGAFSVAAKTQVPVVPITLIGTGQIMPAEQESVVNMGSVKAVIHKPISGNNSEVLCSEARNAIASVLYG